MRSSFKNVPSTTKKAPPPIETNISDEVFSNAETIYFIGRKEHNKPREKRRKEEFERFNKLFNDSKRQIAPPKSASMFPTLENQEEELNEEMQKLHAMLKKSKSSSHVAFGRRISNYSRLSAFGEISEPTPLAGKKYLEIDATTIYKRKQSLLYKNEFRVGGLVASDTPSANYKKRNDTICYVEFNIIYIKVVSDYFMYFLY